MTGVSISTPVENHLVPPDSTAVVYCSILSTSGTLAGPQDQICAHAAADPLTAETINKKSTHERWSLFYKSMPWKNSENERKLRKKVHLE